jgi:hypothetical protein
MSQVHTEKYYHMTLSHLSINLDNWWPEPELLNMTTSTPTKSGRRNIEIAQKLAQRCRRNSLTNIIPEFCPQTIRGLSISNQLEQLTVTECYALSSVGMFCPLFVDGTLLMFTSVRLAMKCSFAVGIRHFSKYILVLQDGARHASVSLGCC